MKVNKVHICIKYFWNVQNCALREQNEIRNVLNKLWECASYDWKCKCRFSKLEDLIIFVYSQLDISEP